MLYIIWILIFVIYNYQTVQASNCVPINTTKPQFSRRPEEVREVIQSESLTLNCCIYGVKKISWYFKFNNSITNWTSRNEQKWPNYLFSDENRTLDIFRPLISLDAGIYKCIGSDQYNNSVSAEIKVCIESGLTKEFTAEGTTELKKIKYDIGSERSINCSVKAYKNRCFFIWEHINTSIIKGFNLSDTKTSDSLIEGYSGNATLSWINLTNSICNGYRIYNFTLNLKNLKESQKGYYRCRIIETTTEGKLITYKFELILNRMNLVHLAAGIMLTIIILTTLAYTFKYDIIIVVKQFIRMFINQSKFCGKHNFFVIYDFDHEDEYKTIFRFVSAIESKGFSVYFYHRDQTYGKDIIEDIVNDLKMSDIVVIWTSPRIWYNSISKFCLQIILNKFKNIKRMYVITRNKKEIFKDCTSKEVLIDTKSCMSSKLFSLDLNKIDLSHKMSYSDIWLLRRFMSWLISSLPM